MALQKPISKQFYRFPVPKASFVLFTHSSHIYIYFRSAQPYIYLEINNIVDAKITLNNFIAHISRSLMSNFTIMTIRDDCPKINL